MSAFLEQTALCFSLLISFGTLLTVTVPALRNKLKERLVKGSESSEEMRRIRALLEELSEKDRRCEEELALQREVELCVLRDMITAIYYRRLQEKKIHVYELEDACALHDLYKRRGGNSYVHSLYEQMSKEWEIIR